MGERLNIEIHKDSKCLANSYYHWSGYTSSTLEHINTVLSNIPANYDNDVVYAIKLLESTGAGLYDNYNSVNEYYKVNKLYGDKYNFKRCIDRNAGLISISNEGIEQNRYWEERRAVIDLTNETVNLQGVIYESTIAEYLDEYGESDNMGIINGKLTYPMLDIDLKSIKFSEFENVSKQFMSLIEKRVWGYQTKDGKVIQFIE